jgi:zinc protease
MITVAETQRIATELNDTHHAVIMANVPKESDMGLPSGDVLLQALASGADRKLPPFQDTPTTGTLLAHAPEPGRIVSQRFIPGLGVTEWKLSNGARVWMKPTPWTKDELMVQAISSGGVSLATDQQYPSAKVASALVNRSGIGQYDAEALQQQLSGLVTGWQTSIDDYSEHVAVDASPRHAETLFQMLYLAFTAPRIDSAEFTKWQHNARRNKANPRDLAIRRALTQRNPRARPVSGPVADSVDTTTVLAFYRERFANAGNFTIVIVGDFTPDSIRALVEQYVGGLPGHPSATPERARDLGIRPPDSVVSRIVVGGDSSSRTRLHFYSAAPVTSESRTVVTDLSAILTRRLISRLREDMWGTYSVSAQGETSNVPYDHENIGIEFESAPERVPELQHALFAVIDTLKTQGVHRDELTYVKNMVRRRHEVQEQDAQYWLSALSQAATENQSLETLDAQERHLVEVTPEMIMHAARQILDPKRYVLVTTLPVRLAPVQEDELLDSQW